MENTEKEVDEFINDDAVSVQDLVDFCTKNNLQFTDVKILFLRYEDRYFEKNNYTFKQKATETNLDVDYDFIVSTNFKIADNQTKILLI